MRVVRLRLSAAVAWAGSLAASTLAWGCPDCRPGREAGALVLADRFWPNLWAMLAPFGVLTVLTLALGRLIEHRDRKGLPS